MKPVKINKSNRLTTDTIDRNECKLSMKPMLHYLNLHESLKSNRTEHSS